MKRAFIFTSDAIFALYLIISILSILFLFSYQPTVHIEQSQNIAEDVMTVMGEYKAGYAQGKSLYPYTNYLLNNGGTPTDWLMFHRSLTHDGYTNSIAPNTNLTFWSVNLTDGIFSSPVVYEGRVVISSESSTYIIDEATGIIIGSVLSGTNSSPAVANGKVFIGAPNNQTYALDRLTGKTLWNASSNGSISSSPAVHNGKVFIGSNDGIIYAFDADSGAQIWNQTTGGAISSSPAVAGEKVFIVSKDGYLYALNENDGVVIWRYQIASGADAQNAGSSPAVANGKVFIGSPGGNLFAIYESNGSLVWQSTGVGGIYSSSPAVANGKVFIGAINNKIYAFNESNGVEIWNYTAPSAITYSSPAVSDGKVFIGTDGGILLVLNETNGNLIWSYSTGSEIQSSPAVSDGRVYVGNRNGILYSFGDCAITDLNKTILELIGEFWSINKTGCSANLFQDMFQVGHVATYSNKLLLRFNEGTGSMTTDVMNANNGVLVNSPDWTTGKIGKGLQFNGINQSVVVNNSPSLSNLNNFTLEAWVKSNSTTQTACAKIVAKDSGSGCGNFNPYSLQDDCTGNRIGAYIYANTIYSLIGPKWSTDWTHVAMTYNGTTLKLYINGILYNETSALGTICTNSMPLLIGGRTTQYFNGTIDEVAIYNETKNFSEIQRDYLIEGVIPSRYGFELAIEAGSGAGTNCNLTSSDWDTIITNDCGQSKYTKLSASSKHFISAVKQREQAMAVPYALGTKLIRMNVWN